jgi:hypothetical protein
VVVHFLLPNGKTRALRALVDTGATDNFVSKSTIEEFKLSCEPFPTPTTVAVGTDDATTEALGATDALTIQLGMLCKHKTNFTVLPLADYDIVLGRPFQKYTKSTIKGDDCFIPTKRGLQALPRWISAPTGKVHLTLLSRADFSHAIRDPKIRDETLVICPADVLKFFELKTQTVSEQGEGWSKEPSPHPAAYSNTHKDPELDKLIKEHQASGDSDTSRKGGEPKTSTIPKTEGVPALDKLLSEYADVFPDDLPHDLPQEREFSMRIPIKPGCQPTSQAPYRISAEAQTAVKETLAYLYAHGLIRDSTSEFAAPITLAPKPDGSWRFCTDYRKLNAITHEAKYPLPRIEDCLDQLKGARIFSKIDLR